MNTDKLLKLLQSDAAANTAYEVLGANGGTVYIVGGAVRDIALNKEPKDIDLMVTGLDGPMIESLLRPHGRLDLTGKQFGVYRFKTHGDEVEIAMPRQEFGNTMTDFRVDATIPIEDDLGRRDFTANAMAVNLVDGTLVDPYNGLQDVTEGVLRTVSPTSFTDDPTRLLRAMTAVAKHQLKPTQEMLDEMRKNAHKIASQPPERLQMELDKLLSGKNPSEALQIAESVGMLKHIIPEVSKAMGFDQRNPHHDLPVGEHLLSVLEAMTSISGDIDLRMAALLHDIGKPDSFWQDEDAPDGGGGHFYKHIEKDDAGNILAEKGEDHEELGADMADELLKRLRYSNERRERIIKLIRNHMFAYFDNPRGARRFLRRVDGDVQLAFDLLKLREADASGHKAGGMREFDESSLAVARGLLQNVLEQEAVATTRDLAINGNDLKEIGMKPGPDMGVVLNKLLDVVVENPELNNREDLLSLAQGFLGQRQARKIVWTDGERVLFDDGSEALVGADSDASPFSYLDQLEQTGPVPGYVDQDAEQAMKEEIAIDPVERAKAIAEYEASLPEYKWSYNAGVLDVWPTKFWDAEDHYERTGPKFRNFAQGRFYMDPDGYTELFVWVNRGTERLREQAVEACEEWLMENYGWSSDIVTYESEFRSTKPGGNDDEDTPEEEMELAFDDMDMTYEVPAKSIWEMTDEEYDRYENG